MSTLDTDMQALVARFEEGVSADPTKHMSPEDAATWQKMNDEHGDKFKTANFQLVYKPLNTNLNDLVDLGASAPRNASGWIMSPEAIINRALSNGLISADQAATRTIQQAARDAAGALRASWPRDQGFGSSDGTSVVAEMLDLAGFRTSYVGGRLTVVKTPTRLANFGDGLVAYGCPDNLDDGECKEWEAKFKSAAAAKTVRSLCLVLAHKLTQYDQKYNKNNPYALGHYLEAVSKVEAKVKSIMDSAAPKDLNKLIAAIGVAFETDHPAVKATLKEIQKSLVEVGKTAGWSYGTAESWFAFVGNAPFNVDTLKAIREMDGLPFMGDDGTVHDEANILRVLRTDYSGPLTYYQEKAGQVRETIVQIQHPDGLSKKLLLAALQSLGRRFKLKVEPLTSPRKPQTRGKKAASDALTTLAALDMELTAGDLPGVGLDKDAAALEEVAKLAALDLVADQMIGKTILEQMGGARRLQVMLGVKQFVLLKDGVAFAWPNREPSKGNYIEIKLNGSDLYDVAFFNASRGAKKLVKKLDDMYAEDLANAFERQTGWYLRMASQQAHLLVKVAQTETRPIEMLASGRPIPLADAKKGDFVEVTYKGEKVTGKVILIKKDGTVTVDIEKTKANPGGHSDEDISYADFKVPKKTAGAFDSLVAEGCPDNLDDGECQEWEANTDKYEDKFKSAGDMATGKFKFNVYVGPITEHLAAVVARLAKAGIKATAGTDSVSGVMDVDAEFGPPEPGHAMDKFNKIVGYKLISARDLNKSFKKLATDLVAEGCPDNLDDGECKEWEANTEKYKDVVKDKAAAVPIPSPGKRSEDGEEDTEKTAYEEGSRVPDGWDNGHIEGEEDTDTLGDEGSQVPDGDGNQKKRAGFDTIQLDALVRDGELLGATEPVGNSYTKAFWAGPDHRIDPMTMEGASVVTLWDVPVQLATKLVDMSTRAAKLTPQVAFRLAKPFMSGGAGHKLAQGVEYPTELVTRELTRLARYIDTNRELDGDFASAFGVRATTLRAPQLAALLERPDLHTAFQTFKDHLEDSGEYELAKSLNGVIAKLAPFHGRRAASGLYGHTKRLQADCEGCVRRVQKSAATIARNVHARHPKAAEFLATHARRADSLPAKILVSALQGLGPKVASDIRLAELRMERGVQAAAPRGTAQVAIMAYLENYPNSQLTDFTRIQELRGLHFAKIMSATEDLKKKGLVAFDGVKVTKLAKVTDGDTQTGEGVKSVTDKNASGSGAANAKYLNSLPRPEKDKILRVIAKHYGVSASEIEDEVTEADAEALYEYIGNDGALQKQVFRDFDKMHLASDKTAGARTYGLYGFGDKVAKLGLQACSDLRHEAGKTAHDLHTRRATHRTAIDDFFANHSKQAKCMYSKLLSASFPDVATSKKAVAAPRTVQAWLEWDEG